jgi:uncharacterized membrane protein
LQIEELKRLELLTHFTIEEMLQQLPKDLNETYTRILVRIDGVAYRQAFNVLQWLVSAPRPMLIEELVEVCAINLENTSILLEEQYRLINHNMFELLHDLITIQPPLPEIGEEVDRVHIVALAHFSVQEFLVGNDIFQTDAGKFHIDFDRSHMFMARSCLAYLYHFNSYDNRKQKFPLREYAWYNWERHILPKWSITDDRARRKAVLLYKCLDSELVNSRHAVITKVRPRMSGAPLDCLSALYLLWIWLVEAYLIPNKGDNRKRALLLAINWLPHAGISRLKDALNIPYFCPDFEKFGYERSTLERFCYSPLQTYRREVRLLTILPSLDENTEIRCSVVHASLDDWPAYYAISYTWENPHDRDTVLIEGTEFVVTINLAQILRRMRFRQERELSMVWFDAICINQEDVQEKVHQVTILGSIFQLAQDVVVGLGEEQEGDEVAIEFLAKLALLSPTVSNHTTSSSKDSFRDVILAMEQCNAWPSILQLFRRIWWTRS